MTALIAMNDHSNVQFTTVTENGHLVGKAICSGCGNPMSHLTGWDNRQIMLAPFSGVADMGSMDAYAAELAEMPLIVTAPGGGKLTGHLVDIWICDNDPSCPLRQKHGGKLVVVNVASLPR